VGKYMLIDTLETENLYTFEQLIKLEAFVVYFSAAYFAARRPDATFFQKIFSSHYISFAPTSVITINGVYIMGVKRTRAAQAIAERQGFIPNALFFKQDVLQHLGLKNLCFARLFADVPSDPYVLYSQNCLFLEGFPEVLAYMRRDIASREAIDDLMRKYGKRNTDDDITAENVARYFDVDDIGDVDVKNVFDDNTDINTLFSDFDDEKVDKVELELDAGAPNTTSTTV